MGAVKWNWAVGITTASRRIPTMGQCLSGMAQICWESPRLFMEPGNTSSPSLFEVAATRRASTMGAFPSWNLGISELYLRVHHAGAYLISESCLHFRSYLMTSFSSIN